MRSAAALAVLLAAGVASGGSRPAVTNGVYLRPGHAHTYYLRSTFGLLVSHDDACTFTWLCEDNLGFSGTWDPRVAIASDGTIFAGMYNALRISRDDGCSFTTNRSLPPNTWVDAIDIGPTGEVWVGTATSGGSNDLYGSTDHGETFTTRHQHSNEVWWKSVRVARSDAKRVYAAGYQVAPAPRAHVVRTDDGGEHWVESPLAGVAYGPTPVLLVAAIDPADPDVAYVVSTGANKGVGDILYRTRDGGQTLAPVLSVQGAIGDVVIADAGTVLATTLVQQGAATAGGPVYASQDRGLTFAPLAGAPALSCLATAGDGSLLGCSASAALATSNDAGKTWQPKWQLAQLAGVRTCPAGTVEHDVCGPQKWPALARQIGATGPNCSRPRLDDTRDPAPPEPPSKSGSCNAGGSAGVLVGLLALGIRRRR